ncbi:ABC transporter ATP-binding protein [Telmatospirillum sp. J64-1]|uniref:ABC transporter ATP-binding protein n=1 Tax=Telmatospirillum sp. J64-1 TaxID=2502183 RepID=UPI00115E90B4|nr:ABC transporter ATP-binding protein [Telmatospirillum sp. J64-1]
MISVSDVHVTFNPGTPVETRALRGLSLDIPAGEFVTVIGSNGAGKSTMLGVLSGEVFPDTGRIAIDEQDVTRWPTPKRAPLVARVFQDPMAGTCEGLTIEENMALAWSRGHRRGLGRAVTNDLRDIFREKLALLGLGLENRLGDRMGLLSGGQRQAITLVMATLNPMKILLLDEHTAALDPKTAAFVMDLTDRIVQDGKLTTLMVTHSMRQALDHGHRTVMLHEGRVVLDVAGSERKGMKVEDLLHMFEKVRGQQIDDDALLLG